MTPEKREYEKIYFFLLVAAYVILAMNIFYYAQPVFSSLFKKSSSVRSFFCV